jgi:uncharacterized Zn finger protein
MTDEAGRLKNGTTPPKACTHGRVVDYVLSTEGKRTGELRCKECGAVFPDKEAPGN